MAGNERRRACSPAQKVNSVQKVDKDGSEHPPEGLAEFITTLIANFKATDGLTFARPPISGVRRSFTGSSSTEITKTEKDEIRAAIMNLGVLRIQRR